MCQPRPASCIATLPAGPARSLGPPPARVREARNTTRVRAPPRRPVLRLRVGDASPASGLRSAVPYDLGMIDELRAAVEALNRGDPGPFASLFAEDAEWRGLSRGHLWWKRTPS